MNNITIYQPQFKRALTAHLIGKRRAFGLYYTHEKYARSRGVHYWDIDGVSVKLNILGLCCSIKTRRLYQPAFIVRVI